MGRSGPGCPGLGPSLSGRVAACPCRWVLETGSGGIGRGHSRACLSAHAHPSPCGKRLPARVCVRTCRPPPRGHLQCLPPACAGKPPGKAGRGSSLRPGHPVPTSTAAAASEEAARGGGFLTPCPVCPQLPRDDGGPQPWPRVPAGHQRAESILGLPVSCGASECSVHGELQPQHTPAGSAAAPPGPLGLPGAPLPLGGAASPCTPPGPRRTPAAQHHLAAVRDLAGGRGGPVTPR